MAVDLGREKKITGVVGTIGRQIEDFFPFLVAVGFAAKSEKQARACLTPRLACWGDTSPQTPLLGVLFRSLPLAWHL